MLLTKEQELLERDQTVQVLREEASSHCTEPLKASRPLAIWKAAANSWMVKDACGISKWPARSTHPQMHAACLFPLGALER